MKKLLLLVLFVALVAAGVTSPVNAQLPPGYPIPGYGATETPKAPEEYQGDGDRGEAYDLDIEAQNVGAAMIAENSTTIDATPDEKAEGIGIDWVRLIFIGISTLSGFAVGCYLCGKYERRR